MFNFKTYVYLCTANNAKWEYRRFESFMEADKTEVKCDCSTMLSVPFFIPRLLHGVYLTRYIKIMFNPCKSYTVLDK